MTQTTSRAHAAPLRSSRKDAALRKARVCYDHLAGELGVDLFAAFEKRGWLRREASVLRLTPEGERFCAGFGIDVSRLTARRPLCRACLDGTERRDHLAGQLGTALLERCFELGWAKRRAGTRIVDFTDLGEREFRKRFDQERRVRGTRALAVSGPRDGRAGAGGRSSDGNTARDVRPR